MLPEFAVILGGCVLFGLVGGALAAVERFLG